MEGSMKHIMVDCETLGLMNDALILSIGAVEFDPYSTRISDLLHEAINTSSSRDAGLQISGDTVLWWLSQEPAAQAALVKKLKTADTLGGVLRRFTVFVVGYGDVKLWSCGARDLTWLESAYAALGQPVPWGYRTGDYRTIRDEFALPEDKPPHAGEHDALADALYQAKHLQNIYKRLGKTA